MCWGRAQAAMVRFEVPNYTVGLNGILDLNVLIEYEQGEPTDLFSYGLRVEVLDPSATNFVSLELPLALNYDSVNGAPAVTDLSPAVLGAKGTIDVFDSGRTPYTGSLLATYQMQFVKVGTVNLKLHAYNTLGPSEELFVSGGGGVLDDFIVFKETEVTVIPEPSVVVTWMTGLLALLAGWRRRGWAWWAWGREYGYFNPGRTVESMPEVVSTGVDGLFGTDDDLSSQDP